MRIDIPFTSGLSLKIDSTPENPPPYPTARIQKGWVLVCDGVDLCEEGVGFGVPVIKRGLQAIFPSAVELSTMNGASNAIIAGYKLDLVEKLVKAGYGTINNPILYHSKNILAFLIRKSPSLRGLLTNASNLLRSSLAWETIYEPANFTAHLSITYLFDPLSGKIRVQLNGHDRPGPSITEIVLMNEQGGHHFDQYLDSNGTLQLDDDIGCWDEVSANQASFINRRHQVSFSLPQVEGAKLFRGREVVGRRLAWSGFGYSSPPTLEDFSYDITLRRIA